MYKTRRPKVTKYTIVESNEHIKYVFHAQDYGGFVCDHGVPMDPNRQAFTGLCIDCAHWISKNIVCEISDKPQ